MHRYRLRGGVISRRALLRPRHRIQLLTNRSFSWSSSAVFRGSKMTFHTLKLMTVKRKMIDNSRRAPINERVTQKETKSWGTLRGTCSRTDKYFPPALIPASPHVNVSTLFSLHPLRLLSRLSFSSLVLLHRVAQLYLFMQALSDCMNILMRCICGEPFLYRALDLYSWLQMPNLKGVMTADPCSCTRS